MAAALSVAGCAGAPRPVPVQEPLSLPEDALGVVGAPVDQTVFDFESEGPAEAVALELTHVPETALALEEALAPFLEMRRSRLQRLAGDGKGIVVITRLGQTAQAFEVTEPQGPLSPITATQEPVVQIGVVPRRSGVWLYRSDLGGTEDYQITLLEGATRSRLTDGKSRSGPFAWSGSGQWLAYTSNARDEGAMDVIISDGKPGGVTRRVLETVGSWTVSDWSPDDRRLLLRQYLSFTHSVMHLLDWSTGTLTALPEPAGEPGAGPRSHLRARYGGQDEVYVTSDLNGETVHLYRIDLTRGVWRDLTPDARWDVDEVAFDHAAGRVAYTLNEDGLSRLFMLDLNTGKSQEMASLPRLAVISDLRLAQHGELLGFTLDTPTAPADVFTMEVPTGVMTRWTDSHDTKVDHGRFVTPTLIRAPSFDGLEVPAWVYAPPGPGPHPAVLWMHGGPEEQYQPVFNPMIQFMVVELGVAVVAPNIRGSSGYGRRWVNLDNGMARGDAIADIGALLDWIDAEPSLDGGHVGIYGASYGGFAVLAALAAFPERLAAGCDLVGVSNFVTFLENTRAYRQDQRRAEYGDEREPIMRAYLESISPVRNAHKIQAPLFVAHGANDPRVPIAEARQIVAAVEDNDREAWLMVAPDEGHGFTRRRNRDRFYGAMMTFFRHNLWPEPADEDLEEEDDEEEGVVEESPETVDAAGSDGGEVAPMEVEGP